MTRSRMETNEHLFNEINDLHVDEVMSIIAIIKEYKRAIDKHPAWPDNHIEQAAIVCEESGELIRAALQNKYESGHRDELQKEAIHTGAMALRFLTNL